MHNLRNYVSHFKIFIRPTDMPISKDVERVEYERAMDTVCCGLKYSLHVTVHSNEVMGGENYIICCAGHLAAARFVECMRL